MSVESELFKGIVNGLEISVTENPSSEIVKVVVTNESPYQVGINLLSLKAPLISALSLPEDGQLERVMHFYCKNVCTL